MQSISFCKGGELEKHKIGRMVIKSLAILVENTTQYMNNVVV